MTGITLTGRFGNAHDIVATNGRGYLVIEHRGNENHQAGLYIYGPDRQPALLGNGDFAGMGSEWVSYAYMVAMNPEDAARNFYQALTQDRVRQDMVDENWMIYPFSDDDGRILPNGADRGGGYDAYLPDAKAMHGITLPQFFSRQNDTGFVPESVTLRLL